jgi:phosphoribosylformimino-5-aminoimidazole carboxamide ribotide isomerase
VIAIPAIDLRDGACVQLVGGSYAHERVRLDDPLDVARTWSDCGFTRVHVVDLDAATGHGSNDAVVEALIGATNALVQVGGGVRTTERVDELLEAGARYVVVGTRAVEDSRWLGTVARAHPGSVIVAADVRERLVVTRGWRSTTARNVVSFVEELSEFELAGVLVTAVHKEGLMQGCDVHLMEDVVQASANPVLASGGIRGRADLDELSDAGVAGAIIGMALYTGALDPRMVAEEYGDD